MKQFVNHEQSNIVVYANLLYNRHAACSSSLSTILALYGWNIDIVFKVLH